MLGLSKVTPNLSYASAGASCSSPGCSESYPAASCFGFSADLFGRWPALSNCSLCRDLISVSVILSRRSFAPCAA